VIEAHSTPLDPANFSETFSRVKIGWLRRYTPGHIGLIEEALDILKGNANEGDRGEKIYGLHENDVSRSYVDIVYQE
jgi:hypothetical protein